MENKSLAQFFSDDHDRIDILFKRFRALKVTTWNEAIASFGEFRGNLLLHIQWEEEILFPLFEEKMGTRGNGPTSVMRAEHTLIKKYLERVAQKISIHDQETEEEEKLLLKILFLHNLREEQVLYPAIDRETGEAERAEVFGALEKVRFLENV